MSDNNSQFEQSSPKDFTLFEQDGILITLKLPKALQINQNRQESYTSAPMLYNKSSFHIKSATFTVELQDVIDASSNAIASVRWWDADTFNGVKSMKFSCKDIKPGETIVCKPDDSAYTQVRWNATVSSGRGAGKFTSTVSLVELDYGPLKPNDSNDGPTVQIG
ncbi:hypothetical protein B6N31_02810 [Dickeya fangzhongdai]|uniref:hypothetical protein n=1 Tax=Dickeya fangzhongdai TaxID=1778540 RepID=UPI000EAEBF29|nr:hypothetical protein [Dickeya fangzhongdai]AYH46723.1 hypothetical protein B6N31_02810 [Dickeya fangzhongdai]